MNFAKRVLTPISQHHLLADCCQVLSTYICITSTIYAYSMVFLRFASMSVHGVCDPTKTHVSTHNQYPSH